ncbi:MAG: altronate dehydratase family protein [Armatimonadota bacterium]|nr:altronate dehydratase family protein [Armatimonadota bacterium]
MRPGSNHPLDGARPDALLESVAVLVDPRDDVAVARVPLAAGTRLRAAGDVLTLSSPVAPKHKFAIRFLPAGAAVHMYGAPVGVAARPIAPGEPLTQENLSDRTAHHARPDPHTRPAPLEPPCPMPHFLGIDRGPGGVGTRNHLLVAYTVPCAAGAAARVVAACRRAFGFDQGDAETRYARSLAFPRETPGAVEPTSQGPVPFPGVDDIVLLHHDSGCGMPDHGDLESFGRWLAHYLRHPNVGGALLLGLGCEKANIAWLEERYLHAMRRECGKPIETLQHQAVGTEAALVRQGIQRVHALLQRVHSVRRVPVPLSRLVLGTKCGGSDGFSGISANPALGWVSDRVAGAGGAVLLPEVPEMYGAEHLLAARAVHPDVAERVFALVRRYADLAALSNVRLAENPSQGNIADGLVTIQMKSLGAVRKAGSGPIAGVLEYGEWAPGPGVWLLDTPGYDVASTAALPASGATLICFTTGLGTPFGNPVVPVVKVSSNTPLFHHMPDVIDFDAGTVVRGEETVAQCGARLLETLLAVASGARTRGEENGHREAAFWRRQCNL